MPEKKVRILTKLKAGMTLDIFEDFQEEKVYEGRAILIEKIKDGDSFYLSDEELKPVDRKSYNDEQILEILKYNRLIGYFMGTDSKKPNVKCKKLYGQLIRLRRDKLSDYEKMEKLIDEYRLVYNTSSTIFGRLLSEYDNYYIIRFIQQDRLVWHHSIFSSERWKVRFIEDHTGWSVDFTTARNIRLLKCVNPKEGMRNSDLVEYTTYDGISSKLYDKIVNIHDYHKKKDKELKESKEKESEMSEDDMDIFITKKLNDYEKKY